MKNHILLTSGTQLQKVHEAKTIPEYMKSLTTDFETKGILRDYTKGYIPAAKKKGWCEQS